MRTLGWRKGSGDRARESAGARQGGGGVGDCLHEFPSGRPASELCPMRSVRGGTRLTFPHHFTVTFGRQAGSHAGALGPELVDGFRISLHLRSSSAAALGINQSVNTPAVLLGCGHPEPSAPALRLRTRLRSSERHEHDSEATTRRAGIRGHLPPSGDDPQLLRPFMNLEA